MANPTPCNNVLDNFDRADAVSLGANWSVLTQSGTLGGNQGIQSNQLYNPFGGFSNYTAMYWNVAQFNSDQETYISMPTSSGFNNNDNLRLYLRINTPGSSFNGYMVTYYDSNGGFTINRYDAGVRTILATSSFNGISAGDGMWFRARGSTLELFKFSGSSGQYSLIFSTTDTTYSSGGYVGFYIPGNSQNGRYDDFGGGSVFLPNVSDTVTTTNTLTDIILNNTRNPKVSDSITTSENALSAIAPFTISVSDNTTLSESTSESVIIPVYFVTLNENIHCQDYYRNLVPNPSFEVDLTGWEDDPGARITSSSFSGSAAASFIATTGFGNFWNTTAFSVTANTKYTFSFYYTLTITSGSGPHVQINLGDPFSGTNMTDQALTAKASFTRWSYTFTTDTNTTAFVRFYNNNGNVSGVMDAFQLEVGDYAHYYFDGSISPATWDGTANNSTSTIPTTNVNLIATRSPQVNDLIGVSESVNLFVQQVATARVGDNVQTSENVSVSLVIFINQVGKRTGVVII